MGIKELRKVLHGEDFRKGHLMVSMEAEDSRRPGATKYARKRANEMSIERRLYD